MDKNQNTNTTKLTLFDLRKEYTSPPLFKKDFNLEDPIAQFQDWFQQAQETEKGVEPNSMVVATCGKDLQPTSRYVLLKEISKGGFVFFTNYNSRKAAQIEENQKVSALFYWPGVNRSVRIEGDCHRIDEAESEAYFDKRPLKSRISAIVSCQSQAVSEEEKEAMKARIEADLVAAESGEKVVKRPVNWGGYRITPRRVEFWQGQRSRFHDRFVYQKLEDGTWKVDLLAP